MMLLLCVLGDRELFKRPSLESAPGQSNVVPNVTHESLYKTLLSFNLVLFLLYNFFYSSSKNWIEINDMFDFVSQS